MATRRRIGVSTATTEAARRQLMQPVPCWEKVWVTYQDAPGSTLKVYKWVKTEKRQQFSDDEEEPDMPLAPLPDEPEGTEQFEDLDPDEQATSTGGADAASRAVSEPVVAQEPEETPVRPKPHPLSMSLVPDSPTPAPEVDGSILDGDLKALEPSNDASEPLGGVGHTSLHVPEELSGDMEDLDMSQLGSDGTQFEAAGDLSQLQAGDSLLGGDAMSTTDDPFQSATIE